MIQKKRLWILKILLVTSTTWARPAQVVLFRHGEKPPVGDHLSDRGWDRAKALPRLLDRPELTQFGHPVALFAMQPTAEGKSLRAAETLQYLAQDLKEPVDTNYPRDNAGDVAKAILTDPHFDGRAVWLCWEHKVLSQIAMALGVDDPPDWPNDQFDRLWVITYDGDNAELESLPERLLPGDSER